jgi:hypothetical protein
MQSNRPKPFTLVMCVMCAVVFGFGLAMIGVDTSQDSPTPPASLLDQSTGQGSCAPTESYEYMLSGVVFPRRADLPGDGPRLSVSGVVRSADCTALGGMLVEFWAADSTGQYTPDSYGSVLADDEGVYLFTTPFPGVYPGSKAPHVHIRVSYAADAVVVAEILPAEGTDSYTLDIVPGFETPPVSTTSTVPDMSNGNVGGGPVS